jgi:hypothetical protein
MGWFNGESTQLNRIEAKLDALIRSSTTMSANVSANFLALQAQVAQTTTEEASAAALIQGIATQLAAAILAANNGDTAALPALQAALASSQAALAAAVVANTPSGPPTP